MTDEKISENETALDVAPLRGLAMSAECSISKAEDGHLILEWRGRRGPISITPEAIEGLVANLNGTWAELAVKDEALGEIAALHFVEIYPDESACCRHDGHDWPCDTQRILTGLADRLSSAERQYDEQGSEPC